MSTTVCVSDAEVELQRMKRTLEIEKHERKRLRALLKSLAKVSDEYLQDPGFRNEVRLYEAIEEVEGL